MVKNPPAMQEQQEMQVRSMGLKDPLEKGMATHSSILAWRIPRQRSLVSYSPKVLKESDTTEVKQIDKYRYFHPHSSSKNFHLLFSL